ncbi:helix-turn-helix transcriptional regulator [Vibrio harveyi]
MFIHKFETNQFIVKPYRNKKVILLNLKGYTGKLIINSKVIYDFNDYIIVIPEGCVIAANLFKDSENGVINFITLNNHDLDFLWQKLNSLNKFIFDKKSNNYYNSTSFNKFISYKNKIFHDIVLMNQIVQEQTCMKKSRNLLLKQSVFNILVTLYINGQDINKIFKHKSEILLSEKLAHIFTKDPRKNWTLELAAQSMALSVSTLRRGLSSEDKSFSQILNNVRIGIAENYLRLGSFSILKVSNLSGFKSSAYFCTVFKKKHLITPQKFRQKCRTTIDKD